MLFYYIRHGDPIYHPDSLTPLGLRQAEAVGRRLATHGLDAVYVSSSNRAQLTAQPTCEMLNLTPTILDWCNEGHAWQELTVEDENGVRHWLFHDPKVTERMIAEDVRILGREWYRHPMFTQRDYKAGIERIQRESDAFFQTLGYRHDMQKNAYWCEEVNRSRIALFAHQGFGLAFLSCLLDVPYPEFAARFDIEHTGMTVINFPEKTGWVIPKVWQLSNDSHLYHENLPTKYSNHLYV